MSLIEDCTGTYYSDVPVYTRPTAETQAGTSRSETNGTSQVETNGTLSVLTAYRKAELEQQTGTGYSPSQEGKATEKQLVNAAEEFQRRLERKDSSLYPYVLVARGCKETPPKHKVMNAVMKMQSWVGGMRLFLSHDRDIFNIHYWAD